MSREFTETFAIGSVIKTAAQWNCSTKRILILDSDF